MRVIIETWTPEKAAIAIAATKEGDNRPVGRNAHIAKLAKDMSEGRWQPGASAMMLIGADGGIVDGQHRLHAVVKSGVTIQCVTRYMGDAEDRDEIFRATDVGAKRGPADFVGMKGVKSANRKSAIAGAWVKFGEAHQERPSVIDIYDLVRRHEPYMSTAAKPKLTPAYLVAGIIHGCLSAGASAKTCQQMIADYVNEEWIPGDGGMLQDPLKILHKLMFNRTYETSRSKALTAKALSTLDVYRSAHKAAGLRLAGRLLSQLRPPKNTSAHWVSRHRFSIGEGGGDGAQS